MSDVVLRAFSQQRNRNKIYESVIKSVEIAAESGIKKSDIALKAGKSRSQLSHFLSGPGNWTVDGYNDVLYAIDAEMDYHVVFNKDRCKGNRFHELSTMGEPPQFMPVTISVGTALNSSHVLDENKLRTTASGSIVPSFRISPVIAGKLK